MKGRFSRGFTLLELMAVIGVIAILAGIIGSVAASSIRSGRGKRAEAMRVAVEQSIAAYYAQEGKWPSVIEKKADGMTKDSYEFSVEETSDIMREVVGKAFGRSGGRKSVLIDASALFVCDSVKAGRRNSTGIDFSEAAAIGSKRNLPLSKMDFGYPDSASGAFRHFWITYNSRTDAVSVSLTPKEHDNQL